MNIVRDRGFSLVEILVGIAVGIIISLGILQLLVNLTQSYKVQNAIKTLNENGQFAMEHLARDIRDAGFWGCVAIPDDITNNLDSSSTGYNPVYDDYTNAIEGTASTVGGGRDTLLIRGADNIGNGMHVQIPYPVDFSSPIAIKVNSGVSSGAKVLVADCLAGDIFQVTNGDASATGLLQHNTGTGSPGNRSASLSKVYSGDAFVYSLYTHIYDIQTGADGSPALFRTTETGSDELVDGVEAMVIFFGEDLTGDGTANRYVRPSGIANMRDVVSVRVELLLASTEDNLNAQPTSYFFNQQNITPTDRKIRRVYSRTMVLKNRTD